MRSRILIWDSNPFNTFGAEVARVIRDSGHDCVRLCRAGAVFAPSDRPLLPIAADGASSLSHRVRYLGALVAATATIVRTRPVVVVPWLNTSYEKVMVRLWQVLGIRTVVVHHNPISSRATGTDSSLEKRVRHAATITAVHSDAHVSMTENPDNARVVTHPAYFSWVDRYVPDRDESSGPRRAVWFGAARADKGFDQLPALAQALRPHGIELVVAPGFLGPQESWVLEPIENLSVQYTGGYVSDNDLGLLLGTGDVLVAPYRDVTASGTVLLALSANLPVAAFGDPALAELLPPSVVADPGDVIGLAAACDRAGRMKPSPGELAHAHDELSRASWAAVINELVAAPALRAARPGVDQAPR